MPDRYSQFLLLPDTRRNLQGLTTDQDAPPFGAGPVSGASMPLAAAIVDKAPPSSALYYQPIDLTGWELIAAIGNAFAAPVAGTYTLTFGASTTPAIPYDANAAAVQIALNALASIVAAGGVTVKATGGQFLVTFATNGAQTQITGDPADLAPLSIVQTGTLIDGSTSLQEVQNIRVMQTGASLVELTTLTAGPGATVTLLQAGGSGLNHKVRVRLDPQPYGGKWSLIVGGQETALLDWNAAADTSQGSTALTVRSALEALTTVGVGNVSVSQEATNQWLIGFQGAKANTNMGTITADGSTLLVVQYLTGTLLLNVPGVELLLAGQAQVSTKFQIIGIKDGGEPQPLYGPVDITLYASIINPATMEPQPVLQYYTKAQADARFALAGSVTAIGPISFLSAVTGYTGGGASNLDGVATTAVPAGHLYGFVHPSDLLRWYKLRAGTDAEASPGIIRPDDFDATSNAKVFVSVA